MKAAIETRRKTSQRRRILHYLQQGGHLTPLKALDLFGTTKLSTRVSELILKEGHTEIRKEPTFVTTRDGDEQRVMSYFIDQGPDRDARNA